MPSLLPTGHYGTIVWLGRVARPVDADLIIHGESVDEMPLTFAGFPGEVHGGLTRASCSRVLGQYPRGTEIANTRQVSVVAAEDLARIAADLGLTTIDPAWLGASVVVEGIADLSFLPPSSRLQAEGGATLVVDLINDPCLQPARTIEQARPGHGKAFKTAAEGLRGLTAWVEREGGLRLGTRLRLHLPSQRPWFGAQPDSAQG